MKQDENTRHKIKNMTQDGNWNIYSAAAIPIITKLIAEIAAF